MKKVFKLTSLVFVLAVILSFFTVTVGASTYPSEDYWATEALNAAVKNQILYGKENGNLDPEVNLTRAEMAAIIVRAFGANIKTDISRFYDVSSSQWYYDDIAKAVHMGVFVGDAGNTMRPDDPIIREEAFTVLARALVLSSSDYSSLNRFTDSWNISEWAKEYLSILAKKGYVNGNQDSEITPKDNITRAEFAQFMHNIFKTYFVTGGTYSSTGADSSLIRHENINLSNLTVPGDLVIGDGANLSTVTLTNVKVQGRLLVRGAAQVKLVNVTVGENVVVKNINSNVHFDNYRTETVFNNINIITSATFKQSYSIGSGGGGGGPIIPPPPATVNVTYYTENASGLYDQNTVSTPNVLVGATFNWNVPDGYHVNTTTGDGKTNPTGVYIGTTGTLNYTVYLDRNSYTVNFNANGGLGAMSVLSYKYEEEKALNLNTFTKEGYTFDGWATTPTGAKVFNDGQSVKNLSRVNNATVTLYARWVGNTYTVSFNANGGSGTMSPQVHTYGSSLNLTSNAYTKEGYTFGGWNTKADGTGTSYLEGALVSNLTSVNGDTVTLYAMWTANSYTVAFNGNGATDGTMNNQDFVYGISQNLTSNAYTKEGYTFGGWNTKADGTGTSYLDGALVSNLTSVNGDTVTLYAMWTYTGSSTPVKVTFHYNAWTGDTLAGDPIELYAGQSIDNVTLKDKKYADVPYFAEDKVIEGYVKDLSVSNVYTEKYQDIVEYEWWYQDNNGRWQLFDENVVVNTDMDVYLKIKRLNIDIQAPAITAQGYVFDVYYMDDTRIIDSVKNLLYTQDKENKMFTHLDIIKMARKDIIYDDKIIEKLIEKNIIDENYNILIQEIMVRYSQVLGEENVEKFVTDSAKESFEQGNNAHLNNGIDDFIEEDKDGILEILSRTDVTKMAKDYIINLAISKYNEPYFLSEIGLTGVSEDVFIDMITNNTNDSYVKVIEYLVNHSHITGNGYSDKIKEYISHCPLLKDDIVDGIIETVYKDDFNTLVKEIKNNKQFKVTDKTIFVAEGLKNKLQKEYSYEVIKAKVEEKVPEKAIKALFEIYPEEKIKEIYGGAFDRLVKQTEQAISNLENNITEEEYIDCGLNFIINPVDDIYTPLYDSFVDILENDSRADKIKDKIKYDENEYLPELVELLSVKSLFNGDIANETTTHSGYQLKDFNYYYNLVLNAVILGDDAVTKYKELFSEDEIDEILVVYEDLALKYANILAEFLDGYANGTKDPDNKYFDKVEGIIKSKFPEQFDKLLNWYKDSPINKKYESDDYAKFRKAVRKAYEKYDMVTDAMFDDEYIDKALSKLDKILVAENTTYTDYKGVTHDSADIYEITVKGKTGRFVVVSEDIYEISFEEDKVIITIARELSN